MTGNHSVLHLTPALQPAVTLLSVEIRACFKITLNCFLCTFQLCQYLKIDKNRLKNPFRSSRTGHRYVTSLGLYTEQHGVVGEISVAAQLFGGLSNFTVQTGCSTLLVAPIRTSETGSVTGWPGGSVDRASDSRSTVAERPEVRTQSASGAQEKVVRGFFPSRKCCAGLTRCRPVGTTVAFVSKYTQPHSLSMTSVVQPP